MLRTLHVVTLSRLRHRFHHHLERGRKQERIAHPVFFDQRERALGIEAAAVAYDRAAEIQRRQQRVHQAAGPRPIRRRPEHVAGLRELIVRVHEAGQVAEQALLRHQRAFRRAGRPAGVDEDRRIGGARGHRRELVRGLLQQPVPVEQPRLARAGDADRVAQAGQAVADRREVRQRCRIDDGDQAFRILQPVFERLGAEQERQRNRDGAQLIAGDVGDRGFGPLRQHDRDACRRGRRRAPPARWRSDWPAAAARRNSASSSRRTRLPSRSRHARRRSRGARIPPRRC